MEPSSLPTLVERAASAYRSGERTPVEITASVLARVERLEPSLNAWVTVTPEPALETARWAERELADGIDRGPLHGIPVGLKDLIDTAGVRTTCGSRVFAGRVPERDAALVTRLREAGAVFVGKTNLLEFAYGIVHPDFGATRNPWNTSRTAGGSSGGSAAAVAAGLHAAVGTDTGGSIRIPAAYCGVLGLKPSYGLVDLEGIFPLSPSLDHAGPIARSARDAALLLEALTGRTFALSPELRGVRFGIDRSYIERVTLEAGVASAFERACGGLEAAGASLKEVRVPGLSEANAALMDLLLPEASVVHEALLASHADDYAPLTRAQVEAGFGVSAAAYVRARRFQRELKAHVARTFDEVDALLLPTAPWVAPAEDPAVTEGEGLAEMHFTGPFNLLGLPALTVPCGLPDGLPVGLQIVTGAGQDARALSLGAAFEGLEPSPLYIHPS